MRTTVLATAVALLLPASAGATTIGSTAGVAMGPFSGVTLMTTDPAWRAPSDGIITAFSAGVQGNGATPGTLRLKVVRGDGPPFSVISQADGEVPANAAATVPTTVTTGVRLPVRTGDRIAMRAGNVAGVLANFANGSTVHDSNDPAVGGLWTPPSTMAGTPIAYSARLEPDADGDGYGDETQDACPGGPRHTAPCLGDLQAKLTAAPATVSSGDVTTLVATGTSVAAPVTGAAATITVPPGLTVLAAAAPGGACTTAGAVTTCPLGDLDTGAARSAFVVVRGSGAGTRTATATVAAPGTPDATPADNTTSTDVTVTEPPAAAASGVLGTTTMSPPATVAKLCRVPKLKGASRAAAAKRLKAAGCAAPKASGARGKRARVTTQTVPAGIQVAPATRVGVTLRVPKRR